LEKKQVAAKLRATDENAGSVEKNEELPRKRHERHEKSREFTTKHAGDAEQKIENK